MPSYPDWKSKRAAQLGVDEAPGDWIWFDTYPGYEDWYHVGNARAVANSARQKGLPPELGIAAAMDESGLANTGGLNLMRVFMDKHPEAQKAVDAIEDDFSGRINQLIETPAYKDAGDLLIGAKTGPLPQEKEQYIQDLVSQREDKKASYLVDYGMDYLKKGVDKYGLNPTGLQVYSGKGSKPYGGRTKGKYFGKSQVGMDLRKTKDQGTRKMALMQAVREHPDFQSILNEE